MRQVSLISVLAALVAGSVAVGAIKGDAPPEGMTTPHYTEEGELVRPEGYETWVFVGASLGLSYSEKIRREGPGRFHHVYLQPEAYEHYKTKGTFPEKTMLVMENYSAAQKESINLHGHFQKDRVGMEVALKDHDQFEDGWAYFNFSTAKGPLTDRAKAFPKAACYDCHEQHAEDDNVFVQFYPVLREIKEKRDTAGKDQDSE